MLTKEKKKDEIAELKSALRHPDERVWEFPGVFPKLVSKVEPKVPEEVFKSNPNLSGSVVISMDIDATGHPQNLVVVGPLGASFNQNAVDAVSSWTFQPATRIRRSNRRPCHSRG